MMLVLPQILWKMWLEGWGLGQPRKEPKE